MYVLFNFIYLFLLALLLKHSLFYSILLCQRFDDSSVHILYYIISYKYNRSCFNINICKLALTNIL